MSQLVIEELFKSNKGVKGLLDITDFCKKQMVFVFPSSGDKLSLKNDNIVVRDKDGNIKHQSTCYKLFILFIVGDITITSRIIRRSKKFGFSICMMTQTMKLYQVIGVRMEGNTELRKKQYEYDEIQLGKNIIINKIENQRKALSSLRNKKDSTKEAIIKLDEHNKKILNKDLTLTELLGMEGSAARTYFSQVYINMDWNGRKPRIKYDYINATLDIGYNILFNFIDAILQVYGFDVYYGVLHKCFYMRKSLVCDIMEPFRPIIDLQVRKSINLGQCKREDFQVMNKQWILNFNKSPEYVKFFMEALLNYKEDIFKYVQGYYRSFMKSKPANEFPQFQLG